MKTTTSATGPDYSQDAGLSRRAATGEREAQQQLFRALRASVHGTLFRVLGSNEHMEDLIQDAFIEIFRSLPSYRGEAQLSTWADRIAARVAYHYLRRLPRKLKEPEAPALQLVASSEEDAVHREGVKRLYAILRRLKPEYRVPFALFALDGRSMEEIAGIMGVTVVAAKNRVSRARRRVWEAARRDNVLAAYLLDRGEAPDEDVP
jgi:RNA polymerase sigma-70 factor, ECF subfamily